MRKGEKMETEGKSEQEKEVLHIDEQCKITFHKSGIIEIGDCKGRKINPVEIHLLDRVNRELDNQ